MVLVSNVEVSVKETKGSSDSCSFKKNIVIKNNLYHHLESVCYCIASEVCLNWHVSCGSDIAKKWLGSASLQKGIRENNYVCNK